MAECTIVVPCYNEANRLNVTAFRRFICLRHHVRFLLVNDGSTDETLAVLETLRASDPERFSVLDLPRNGGKAEAVRQGMLQALAEGCDVVGFWDADLATPLESIPEFCDQLLGNATLQMVLGSRVKLLGRRIERRPLRHYLGRVFATAASTVLWLPVYDTQCGAKLFRATPAIRSLFEESLRTNWIFDVELLARFRHVSMLANLGPLETTIYELPLSEWRDVAGSKVRTRDFFKAFFELVVIYWAYLRRGAAWSVTLPPPVEEKPATRQFPRRAG